MKSEKWTKEMDLEMKAIERSREKKIGVKSIYKTKLDKNRDEWINTTLGWYKKDILENIKWILSKYICICSSVRYNSNNEKIIS